MNLTGAEILTEVLLEQGVDTIFGYPGGAVLNIYDTLYDYQDRITHILTAHEQGASHAADGYARATGKTGVVLATSGPGATNLVTGIATAYMDSIPMVAITGNVSTSLLGRDSFQEIYITGITMPITKHNFLVRDVEELADTIRSAFRIANSGRKGPVLIDIPKDITAAKCEFVKKEQILIKKQSKKNRDQIEKVSEIINEAKRPVIYFGGGVSLGDASKELKQFINKSGIPAVHTMMGAGVLCHDDIHNLGLIGMHGKSSTNNVISDADVVIAIGARFSDRVALNPKYFAQKATIIQLDIDQSEINKNVYVDYGVVGDVKDILNDLYPRIKENQQSEWMKKIQVWQDKDYKPVDSDTVLKPHQIIRILCEMSEKNTVYVTDVGQHQMWAAQYLEHLEPRCFITSGGLGTMGFGYGAAIGAKFGVMNEKRVIHITGDGSFHMNLNEACTAKTYELPIITIIMNNSVLGMVRQWQTSFYKKKYSHTDPQRKTDFMKVAEGFGVKGYRASNPKEFEAVLKEALEQKGPVWIECLIDKDEKVLPMIPAGGTIDDMIMD
ncbi:biosynthetic-type acetolactate synthase large subunit [Sinanaerobacter sp. ZZT-01]|uniref:biosynthetic-type acetolactate synthase large subunit n=1 Tax=Sinanaerobacter sp. ZZT-01 TaxID=3111540 RepID=UPI002D772346|nr:biosynthetic-type acetolactate synthase large subunit [Sinanaerobacter sp. ZZT-01]WRR93170.1 biosynthetic-type acetolactate synthase large subunit [Sinanaerobacter sp. ZZT-01]